MKPPICQLCHRHCAGAADLVQFADYTALPPGMTGHPHGLEWFCAEHLEAARALAALPVAEAMARLEQRYG